MKKAVVTLSFLLLAIMIYLSDLPAAANLILDMMLAMVAFYASDFAKDSSHIVLAGVLSLVWFLFYPNTFYMLTDLFDLGYVPAFTSSNAEALTFFMYYGSIFFGIHCGIVSFQNIAKRFKLKESARYVLILLLSLVTAVIIYNSRFSEIDSWSMISNPLLILQRYNLTVIEASNLPFILGFTGLQMMSLMLLDHD